MFFEFLTKDKELGMNLQSGGALCYTIPYSVKRRR